MYNLELVYMVMDKKKVICPKHAPHEIVMSGYNRAYTQNTLNIEVL